MQDAGHEAIALDLPGEDPHAGLTEYAELAINAAGGHQNLVVAAQSMGAFTAVPVCERIPVHRLVRGIVPSMARAMVVAASALLAAIPVGVVGAWAFNPDSGAVLHSEVLWRIFGIMAEGGAVLLIALLLIMGLAAMLRTALALSRSHQTR